MPPQHVVDLGCVVEDLVRANAEETDVHQVDDRAHSGRRRTDACAHKSGLRDWRVANPLWTELSDKPLGKSHRAAPRVFLVGPPGAAGDVLAHDEDALVALHLLAKGLVDGLDET